MKIYLASPGVDTGVFPDYTSTNLLFSYYDLSGKGIGVTIMRKKGFDKVIKEMKEEMKNENNKKR